MLMNAMVDKNQLKERYVVMFENVVNAVFITYCEWFGIITIAMSLRAHTGSRSELRCLGIPLGHKLGKRFHLLNGCCRGPGAWL